MSVRFKNSEYIGQVESSVAFAIQKYSVNPGLAQVFPFLSQLAANFENYRFNWLMFEFRSTSATALNSTNTALGTVMLVNQYDVDASPFTGKTQLMNYYKAKSRVPFQSQRIVCRRNLQFKWLKVRAGSAPSNVSLDFYDYCNFYVATDGSQAAADIGELWVHYDVVLARPQLYDAQGWETSMAIFYNATGVANATPFGTGLGAITAASMPARTVNVPSVDVPVPEGVIFNLQDSTIYFNPSYGKSSFIVSICIRCRTSSGTPQAPVIVNAPSLYKNAVGYLVPANWPDPLYWGYAQPPTPGANAEVAHFYRGIGAQFQQLVGLANFYVALTVEDYFRFDLDMEKQVPKILAFGTTLTGMVPSEPLLVNVAVTQVPPFNPDYSFN